MVDRHDGAEWRACKEFPDYEISSEGQVRRCVKALTRPAGGILKAAMHYGGYLQHGLRRDGKSFNVLLNRLVCAAFHGAPPTPEHVAAHRDGDRQNNRASNLRWATNIENEADKDRHGTRRRGAAIPWAKLTEGQVAEIRRRRRHERLTYRALAEHYKVSIGAISMVLSGRRWRHVKVVP